MCHSHRTVYPLPSKLLAVDVASVEPTGLSVTLARGCVLTADTSIEAAAAGLDDSAPRVYDCIALPGGMPGAEHLRDSAPLAQLLKQQKAAGRWIAAICASPAVVLAHHGLLQGISQATCYPSFMDRLCHQHSHSHSTADGSAASAAVEDGAGTPNNAPVALKAVSDRKVVVDVDGKMITSRGPATAIEFALQVRVWLSSLRRV